MNFFRIFGFALLFGLLLASPALAHKVNLFAYVEGGIIYTESYFPDGRAVTEGQVEIRDAGDQLLVSGKTNNQGLFACPIPQVAELKVHIIASMGHRNLFTLSKAEIEAGQ